MRIRPETFCYLLRVIARPSCAFWRSRCPPWSQGCSAPPSIAAGVWYKHLDGGFPVQGVRFGGLKSAKFGLPTSLCLCRDSARGTGNSPAGSWELIGHSPPPLSPGLPSSWYMAYNAAGRTRSRFRGFWKALSHTEERSNARRQRPG
jgi:hypothetical protein